MSIWVICHLSRMVSNEGGLDEISFAQFLKLRKNKQINNQISRRMKNV